MLEDPLAPAPDDDAVGTGGGFTGARFRQVLGHFATGVTVVTAQAEGRPAGLSVNSFTSVSLRPPLVGFCVAHNSATWSQIERTAKFCVNVLGADQEALSRTFAGRAADKFAGVGWRPAPSESPILDGVLAWLDCTVEAIHEAGDHLLVLGRVHDLDVGQEGAPLVFYRGGYGRFEP